jgi:hypothetical protein
MTPRRRTSDRQPTRESWLEEQWKRTSEELQQALDEIARLRLELAVVEMTRPAELME